MSDTTAAVPALVPARMVNEFCYCPRLFYLEWVDSQFQGNADTATGVYVHRAVDRAEGRAPGPNEADELRRATSVTLSSERLGLIATIDLLEPEQGKVVPIDLKKGRPPPHGPAWEPELVQLCVQGLVLRDNGYLCDEGIISYAETRERRTVVFDDALVERTLEAVRQLREVANLGQCPPPLVDSPKCPRCSLVGICLPDETNLLIEASQQPPRRLLPREQAARPLYVGEQGSYVGMRSGRVEVSRNREKIAEVRLLDVSQLNVTGNVQISTQLIRECFRRELPVLWFSYGGWFSGLAEGLPSKNVELRRRQAAIASQAGLPVARAFVAGKIRNCRTLLRRNARSRSEPVLESLKALAVSAESAPTIESLLGVEGSAARLYFSQFSTMLREDLGFDFDGRNRRPPLDPVNCLLSYLYGLLAKDLTVTAFGVGFDPYLGFFHRPRFGRPALALDLAEEFRPLIADSVTINVINNGEVRLSSFVVRAAGVALTADGRKAVISAYERRLDMSVTHPLFGYKATYRRIMEVQSRLLAAYLLREVPSYHAFTTR
ncbi:MAG: CRISPR-associated endonuclease Cas4g/Cas1g [Acidimicrobiales bacterium]